MKKTIFKEEEEEKLKSAVSYFGFTLEESCGSGNEFLTILVCIINNKLF
jgi:hypothetical protein